MKSYNIIKVNEMKQKKQFSNEKFINKEEIDKFNSFADSWWDPNGKMKSLHWINPTRVSHIKKQICEHLKIKDSEKPLKGLKVLDIGCGAGVLSESMALLGADVVGIDVTENMILVAKKHATKSKLKIDYRIQDINDLVAKGEKFDVVLCMEVVEHIDNLEDFLPTCNKAVKDGGLLIITTINRTVKSYATAIIAAEYILRWLPIGTHEWHKFVKPSELCNFLEKHAKPVNMMGMVWKPFSNSWEMGKSLDINYTITFKK